MLSFRLQPMCVADYMTYVHNYETFLKFHHAYFTNERSSTLFTNYHSLHISDLHYYLPVNTSVIYTINTFTAIVDLSRSNFSIARAPLFQLKSAM